MTIIFKSEIDFIRLTDEIYCENLAIILIYNNYHIVEKWLISQINKIRFSGKKRLFLFKHVKYNLLHVVLLFCDND